MPSSALLEDVAEARVGRQVGQRTAFRGSGFLLGHTLVILHSDVPKYEILIFGKVVSNKDEAVQLLKHS